MAWLWFWLLAASGGGLIGLKRDITVHTHTSCTQAEQADAHGSAIHAADEGPQLRA